MKTLRWIGVILGTLLVLMGVAVAGGLTWLHSESGQRWILVKLVEVAQPHHGRLDIARLETDGYSHLRLDGLVILDPSGKELAGVDTLDIHFSLRSLLHKTLHISSLSIVGLHADLTSGEQGIDLAELWTDPNEVVGPSQPYSGLPVDLLIKGIYLTASHLEFMAGTTPLALSDLTLQGELDFVGDNIRCQNLHLDTLSYPDLGPVSLRVDLSYDADTIDMERLELFLGPQSLSLSGGLGTQEDGNQTAVIHINSLHVEPELLPWDLPVVGVFDLTGEVTGQVETPQVELQLATPGGPIQILANLDQRPSHPVWGVQLDLYDVALDTFIPNLPPTRVTVVMEAEGSGITWPDDVQADLFMEGTSPLAGPLGTAAVSTSLSVEKGVVTVHHLMATTPSGRLESTARVDILTQKASAVVVSLGLNLEDLGRFGAPGVVGTASFEGQVDGAWSGKLPTGQVTGSLSAVRFGYQDITRVAALSGPLHVVWAGESGDFTGEFRASGVSIPPTRMDDATLNLQGTFSREGALDMGARARLTGLHAGNSAVTQVKATGHARRNPNGDVSGNVAFTTTNLHAGTVSADSSVGTVWMVGDQVQARLDIVKDDHTVLGVDALGNLKSQQFEIPRFLFAPDPTSTWVGVGVLKLTLADDGVDDVWFEVSSGLATLQAAGQLHTRGVVDMKVDISDFPLTTLQLLGPEFAGYTGTLNLEGEAGGRWPEVTLALTATADDVVIPGKIKGIHSRLEVEGREGTLRVEASVQARGQTLATLTGLLPVSLDLDHLGFHPDESMDLSLVIPPGTSEDWNQVIDAVEIPTLRASGQIHLFGTPESPDVLIVAAVELPPQIKGEDWIHLDMETSVLDEHLTTRLVMSEDVMDRVTMVGTSLLHLDSIAQSFLYPGPTLDLDDPATWASDLDLTLTPDLPLQSLSTFMTIPEEVQGQLVGTVHLKGSPTTPTLQADLAVRDLTLDSVAVTPATLSLAPTTGGYDIQLDLGFGSEGDVQVDAFVPLNLQVNTPLAPQLDRQGLRVDITGAGIALSVVAAVWPDMLEAGGQLEIGGTLEGSLKTPTGNLHMNTRDAHFELASTGVSYDEVNFDLVVAADAIRLTQLHARTTPPGDNPERGVQGTLDGTLTAKIDGTTLGEWTGYLSLDHTLLSGRSDRYIRVSQGKLLLSGIPPQVKVNGAVYVEEAQVHLDQHFFTHKASRTPPPWLHVHRGTAPAVAEVSVLVPDSGIPDWLDTQIGLDLDRSLFLRAQLPLSSSLGPLLGPIASVTLDAQTDGTLSVSTKEGALSVNGQVIPVRGTVVLFGKTFEMRDDSTLSFTGRDFASPVLNIHATYDTRSYGQVEATISGVPESLAVTLTSSDYPSQDDVISLLLIGKPASEMSSGEGARDGASAVAVSMLLTTLGQTLGREGEKAAAMVIAPDLFVVGNETARIGKQLGKRLFVLVDIDNTADDRTKSYLILTLELALKGPWSAEFTHGTAGQDSMEMTWTRRY